ncbi:MAG: RNA 3'-terminal phosphate cyclase [Candidatus Thermoplasmatota archaeon]|nr:RNA 3'-terminal phosphate cyclase [Candidatus Thermoplasmatota archaeon]
MKDMVHIEGSLGEGGGQVLRVSVALSAATGTPVRITDIRANRKNPGLRPQHVAAVRAVADLCYAETKGLEIGSRELEFGPRDIPSGTVKVDVGTAGSVTLVLQAVLGALSAPGAGPAEVTITGGTDVIMAPSWDYFAHVLVPTLGRAGLDMDMECQRRGFYPKGGGKVVVRTEELVAPLEPIVPVRTEDPTVEGSIVWSGLPDHIPQRIDHAIRKELVDLNVGRIRKKHVETSSPGVVATLWTEMGNAVVGTSMVGRRGLPSERIGEELAREVRADIEAGANADVHLLDQLVVHSHLAKIGSKQLAREVSKHARTAMEVVSLFTV